MINYILQVVLFQVLFLTFYDLFLSKETFFTKNRWYLLSTNVLSFIIPLIEIQSFQNVVSEEFVIQLPEMVLNPSNAIQDLILVEKFEESINYLNILFWIGVVIFSTLFLIKLVKIVNFVKRYGIQKIAEFSLVILPNEMKAFSFCNYIFLGSAIKESNKENILLHEIVHCQQKHSLDLLLFEFLKIAMWFNPMIYIYQNRISLVHEYISDAVVAKSETKETYIDNLLSNFFQVEKIKFVNQFYKNSLIKKRIIMMKKTQSKKMNQLKYLVIIPVLISMLFYSSCASNTKLNKLKASEKVAINKLKSAELNNKKLKDSISKLNEERKLYKKEIYTSEGVSFLKIDKSPTFPGCEEGDKNCFSKNVQMHFAKNFDSKLPNSLNLEPGKKRVFIAFKIDKEGSVVDVKSRAPHPKIEDEVNRVMNSLPKMTPGEFEGETVAVKFAIPFTLFIDGKK